VIGRALSPDLLFAHLFSNLLPLSELYAPAILLPLTQFFATSLFCSNSIQATPPIYG